MKILSLWCRWRGHKWGRACIGDYYDFHRGPFTYGKTCRRCKTVAPVKRRVKA